MRNFLLLLLLFSGISASISGILLILSPDGELIKLPSYLIEGTIFKNYLIPGLILALMVGVTNLTAFTFLFVRRKNGWKWSLGAGVILTGWILAQMIIIRQSNWLHMIYLGIGLCILFITWQLRGKWIV